MIQVCMATKIYDLSQLPLRGNRLIGKLLRALIQRTATQREGEENKPSSWEPAMSRDYVYLRDELDNITSSTSWAANFFIIYESLNSTPTTFKKPWFSMYRSSSNSPCPHIKACSRFICISEPMLPPPQRVFMINRIYFIIISKKTKTHFPVTSFSPRGSPEKTEKFRNGNVWTLHTK